MGAQLHHTSPYLALGELVLAAPQLLAAKRYAEAKPCYRTWLATVAATNVLTRIRTHLGLAALRCTAQATGWQSELNKAAAATAGDYQAARRLLQDEPGAPWARPALLAGQCRLALGD